MLTETQLQALAQMRRTLLCSHCREMLVDPVTMQCGHHYCRACAETVVDADEGCDVCSTPAMMNDLRSNVLISNAVLHVHKLLALSEKIQGCYQQRAAVTCPPGAPRAAHPKAALETPHKPIGSNKNDLVASGGPLLLLPSSGSSTSKPLPSSLPAIQSQTLVPPEFVEKNKTQGARDSVSVSPLEILPSLAATRIPSSTEKEGNATQRPRVLVCTGFTNNREKTAMMQAPRMGASILDQFDEAKVTHIVTPVVDVPGPDGSVRRNVCKRTLKYMEGVLAGCWVVSVAWLIDSVEAGSWLDEAAYEVTGDTKAHGAPAAARLRKLAAVQSQKVFDGLRLSIVGPLDKMSDAELEALLKVGGATMASAAELMADDKVIGISSVAKMTPRKADEMRGSAKGIIVDQAWVMDSVSYHRPLAFSPYELVSMTHKLAAQLKHNK